MNDPSINSSQTDLTDSIRLYMTGKIPVAEFVMDLDQHNINMTERIRTLIRNKEAGNTPKFNEFGKAILRDANGSEMYNRVDKVNMDNNRIVTPGMAGRTFGLARTEINDTILDDIV